MVDTRINDVSVLERIASLPIVDEVDEMLREGLSCADVCKYVQETFELLTDINPRTLTRSLDDRRRGLRKNIGADEWPAAIDSLSTKKARTPGGLAKAQYKKASRGIDLMIETESLYLAQRDRIDRLVDSEIEAGEPYQEMPREMNTALEMLKTHAKFQDQFGPAMNRMRMSLEIQGGASTGLGQKVASVMANPESRHKVLSMVQRFAQAALPENVVADVEGEPVGGG